IATSRTPRPSCWSRTISTSTAGRHSTKPFRPPKPDGWSSASNGTTRLSTAVGSISRNPNSVSSPLSVSIAASQTNRPSSRKSPLGNTTEMPITQRQTGNSQPNPLESNSSSCEVPNKVYSLRLGGGTIVWQDQLGDVDI